MQVIPQIHISQESSNSQAIHLRICSKTNCRRDECALPIYPLEKRNKVASITKVVILKISRRKDFQVSRLMHGITGSWYCHSNQQQNLYKFNRFYFWHVVQIVDSFPPHRFRLGISPSGTFIRSVWSEHEHEPNTESVNENNAIWQ